MTAEEDLRVRALDAALKLHAQNTAGALSASMGRSGHPVEAAEIVRDAETLLAFLLPPVALAPALTQPSPSALSRSIAGSSQPATSPSPNFPTFSPPSVGAAPDTIGAPADGVSNGASAGGGGV